MKSIIGPNISNPIGFLEKLQEVLRALYDLFELSREKEYTVDDGMVSDEKCCYEVARQFLRPEEFLNVLLDMLRVTFDPNTSFNLLLNSNPNFIYDEVPKVPFTLGYLSVVGESTESFTDMWRGQIAKNLAQYGYNLGRASALFVVVVGDKRLWCAFNEAHDIILRGLSALEFMNPNMELHTGFVFDKSMDDRLRVSLWLFLEEE